MRSVIARPRLIVALLSALLIAGCGSHAGKAGSAAIVGDDSISVSTVDERVNALLDRSPDLQPQLAEQGRMDDVARRIAAFEVRKELAAQAARRENLRVSERQIDEWIARQGGAEAATRGRIYTKQDLRSVARALLRMRELGRKHLTTSTVTFDYTQAETRKSAREKAERMARGPEAARTLINQDKADGLAAGTGRKIAAADNATIAASTPLFGATEGTVLAFRGPSGRGTASGWLVARITDRGTDGRSAGTPRRTSPEITQAFGSRLLGLTAQRVGVRLSPRYGVWDPVELTAAPDEGQTSGFRYSPDSARA